MLNNTLCGKLVYIPGNFFQIFSQKNPNKENIKFAHLIFSPQYYPKLGSSHVLVSRSEK